MHINSHMPPTCPMARASRPPSVPPSDTLQRGGPAALPAAGDMNDTVSGGEPSAMALPQLAPVGGSGAAPAASGGQEQGLIEAIKQDPEIQQAFGDWNSLGTDEKLAIGQKISQLQGQAFGFSPATNLQRDPSLAQPGESGTYGLASSDGTIKLSDAALADPAQFLDTLVHEQAHQQEFQQGEVSGQEHAHQDGDHIYRLGNQIADGVFAA